MNLKNPLWPRALVGMLLIFIYLCVSLNFDLFAGGASDVQGLDGAHRNSLQDAINGSSGGALTNNGGTAQYWNGTNAILASSYWWFGTASDNSFRSTHWRFDLTNGSPVTPIVDIRTDTTSPMSGTVQAILSIDRLGSDVPSGVFGVDTNLSFFIAGNAAPINLGQLVNSTYTSQLSLDTNGGLTCVGNVVSRGQGSVVSSLSTVTNTLIVSITGVYGGTPTNVVFSPVFSSVPNIVVGHSDANGTVSLSDELFVTNKTVSGCTIGSRTAAGLSSGATLNYDLIAVGKQ